MSVDTAVSHCCQNLAGTRENTCFLTTQCKVLSWKLNQLTAEALNCAKYVGFIT